MRLQQNEAQRHHGAARLPTGQGSRAVVVCSWGRSPNLVHLYSPHLTTSHPTSPHPTPSHSTPPHPISSHLIFSVLISSHRIPARLSPLPRGPSPPAPRFDHILTDPIRVDPPRSTYRPTRRPHPVPTESHVCSDGSPEHGMCPPSHGLQLAV